MTASDQKQRGDQHAATRTRSRRRLLVTASASQAGDYDLRTLQALQALTDAALSHVVLETLLPVLPERVRDVMQVDSVAILLLRDDEETLEARAACGAKSELPDQGAIAVGSGFAGQVAATRAPLAVDDLATDPGLNLSHQEGMRSALGVPLLSDGRLLGVVEISSATTRPFTASDTALLEQVAERIARAIAHAQRLAAAEQRARELEVASAHLRALVEASPVGIATVDADGKPVLVNDAIHRVWGDDLPIAQDVSQYARYRGWHADSGETVAAREWGLARALTRGEISVGREYDIETFAGQRKTILESAAPLRDEDGSIAGAVTLIFDITERKLKTDHTRDALEAFIAISQGLVEPLDTATSGEREREALKRDESPLARRLAELTRSILDCARVSISVVEGDPPVARPVMVIGLTPEQERQWWAEQREPQPAGAGLLPEDRERFFAGHALALDITRPPYELPNEYGVTAILAAPMFTQGRLVGLLALDFQEPEHGIHSFTPEEVQIAEAVARLGALVLEHDRLLGEREAARAEVLALAEAKRRMDEFLGIAGHELRTPLTTVKANLQLAERRARKLFQAELQPDGGNVETGRGRNAAEQLLRLLEQATVSVERQERLVQDLLDISRISSGRLEYRMERYDLTTLVREAIAEQRLGAPGRRIVLEAPDDPLYVMADADRIGQVLTNYLTNALKYSAFNKPVVVAIRRGADSVRVEVRDQGPGLSAEQQRRLFERFYRVEGVEVVSGSGVGLGLGLYISKTIIEQHGGAVGATSAPGEGSVFWFALPLAEDE